MKHTCRHFLALTFTSAFSALLLQSAPAQAETAGGAFRVGIKTFTSCFDIVQTSYNSYVQQAVVDNLLEQDKKTGEIRPWLAESYEIQDGGKRLVLKLKQGVTFSNGEKFDAAAVKLSLESALDFGAKGIGSGQAAGYLSGLVSADVQDDYTIALNFTTPKAGLLQALTEKPLGIIAPATIRNSTPQERCARGTIGTGPYVISEIVEGQKVVLDARTDYAWASPNQGHAGRPLVDQLVFTLVTEDSTRVGGLLSGQLDAINQIPPLDLDRLTAANAEIVSRSAGGAVFNIYFNYNRPVTADPAVREAVKIAINREELIAAVGTPYDVAATGILSRTVPQYLDLSAELAFAPDRARKILDEAGWVPGPDGIRAKSGQRLTFTYIFADKGEQTQWELVQQQLHDVGIELKISNVTVAEWAQAEKEGNWDINYGSQTRPDPDILVSLFHPKKSWWLRVQNVDPYPAVTQLIEKQAAQTDPQQRRATVDEIQKTLVQGSYAVPVREAVEIWAVSPAASGLWLATPRWANFSDVQRKK